MNKSRDISERDEVFTIPVVVEFMLNDTNYIASSKLSKIKVLETSAGEGAFIIPIISRLRDSCAERGENFQEALNNIYIVEIKKSNIDKLINRLKLECCLSVADIDAINIICDDFLITDFDVKFDIIIGNPPYIRWDNLAKEYRENLSRQFATFTGRCDLYIAFYEKSLALLKPQGILSFLCSNRWFKSAYGKKLRKLIINAYSLQSVINLESTNPFEIDVLGYPAITNVVKSTSKKTKYVEIEDLALLKPGLNFKMIDLNLYKNSSWSFDNSYNALLESKSYSKIEALGYKVNIGIATGKDSVFISSDFTDEIENDILVPIIKGSQLKSDSIKTDLYVINVFDNSGEIIDTNNYPRLLSYFKRHRASLESRHIAKKNPDKWFRTIDKIRENDICASKILLPDISGTKRIHLGGEGAYPHHNIYYITIGNSKVSLSVLAGVLSSNFVKIQLGLVGNKMNGGYPRWQAQNIRKLVIPDLERISTEWLTKMEEAFLKQNYDSIENLMGVQMIEDHYENYNQMVLFEPITAYN